MNSKKKAQKGRPKKQCSGDTKLRGEKLKALRDHLKKNQKAMGEFLGCSPDTISKQERAEKGREIDDKQIQEIAEKAEIQPSLFDDGIDIETFKQRITIPQDSLFSNVSHNIPRTDYEFVGRQKELETLLQHLHPESRQFIISITGVGGVGKSALAIEVAKKCIELAYFDAIIWFSAKKELLEENRVKRIGFVKSNLDGLLTRIIEILDPELAMNLPSKEKQFVRAKGLLRETKSLLIVDNMETVDDDQIRIFIDDIPSPSKVLITDRRSVQSSKAIQLLELSEIESLEIINKGCHSCDLQLSEQQQIFLAEITGGIPLAIKWAIGQIAAQHWDIEMLSSYLSENKDSPILDFLFMNSFQQLSTNSKIIISTLSILPVPVKGEMLSRYNNIPENDTKDSLSQLLQYALISKNEEIDPTVPTSYFVPMLNHRYRVLPLTKSFLKMQEDFTNIELSKKIIAQIYGELESLTNNFTWPTSELIEFVGENRELLVWAIEESFRISEYEFVKNIMKYVGYSLGIRGKHDIRLKLGEMAVEAARLTGDDIEQARNLLLNIGWVYFGWYQFDESENAIKKGIKLAENSNEKQLEAVGIRSLGLIRKEQKKYEEALSLLLKSTAVFDEIKDYHFLAVNYGSLASLARDTEQYQDSKKYLDKAIKTAENLENNDEIISVFKQKTTKLLIKQDQLDEAESYNAEALLLTQKIKRRVGEAYCEHNFALIEEKRGNMRKALKHVERAANLFFAFGAKEDILVDLERIRSKVS